MSAITPVFSHRQDPEEVRRRFPQRAKRAPSDAAMPDLRYVYHLALPEHLDVNHAAAAYARHPDVEYAHPNIVATVQ